MRYYFLASLFTVFSLVISTTRASNTSYSGWHDGPNDRGTITLLWGCITTIIACTWTILHLNLPGPDDNSSTRLLRKTKWMIVTILFPEFIFSKAVCELQMAVDDLKAMKDREGKPGCEGWTVEFGWRERLVYMWFHLFEKSGDDCKATSAQQGSDNSEHLEETVESDDARSQEQVRGNASSEDIISPIPYPLDCTVVPGKQRLWTLTHSYFANMGGLHRYQNPDCASPRMPVALTAHSLVNCCIDMNHSPLPYLNVSKDDIEDKSKADWFVRSIAVLQISWLILSVITRVARGLPTSQLEVCTVAYAILAIFTYMANWSKPKDVQEPLRFRHLSNNYSCNANRYQAESFFRRLVAPNEHLDFSQFTENSHAIPSSFFPADRIGNDFVRLRHKIPSVTLAMAISTAFFGGLHCLAWRSEFPTFTEKVLWMVTSVLSATIPLTTLSINSLIVFRIRWIVRRRRNRWRNIYQQYDSEKGFEPTDTEHDRARPVFCQYGLARVLAPRAVFEIISKNSNKDNHLNWMRSIDAKLRVLFPVFQNFMYGSNPQFYQVDIEGMMDDLIKLIGQNFMFRKENVLFYPFDLEEPGWGARTHIQHNTRIIEGTTTISRTEWNTMRAMFLGYHTYLSEVKRRNQDLKIWRGDIVPRYITIFGGVLYIIVRLLLLVLAFIALRKMDSRVYIQPWTKNLPNVS